MAVSGAQCLSWRVLLALFKFHQEHLRQKLQKIQRQGDLERRSVFRSHSVFLECTVKREEWQEIRLDMWAGNWKGVSRMLCGAVSPLLGVIHKLQKSPMSSGGKCPGQGLADWESTPGSSCFRCLRRLRAQWGWLQRFSSSESSPYLSYKVLHLGVTLRQGWRKWRLYSMTVSYRAPCLHFTGSSLIGEEQIYACLYF